MTRPSPCPTALRLIVATSLTLATGAVFGLPAAAQGSGQTACAPRAQMLALLTGRLGEERRAIGLAGTEAVMELFASDDSGSWSITVTLTDGRTCLVARGTDFAAAQALRMPPPGEGA